MSIDIADKAKQQIKKLPPTIRKKTFKSFSLLQTDYRHLLLLPLARMM